MRYLKVLFIAERTYRCVITLALRSKYDVEGHYFIFAVRMLANPCDYVLLDIVYYDVVCRYVATYRSCISTQPLI